MRALLYLLCVLFFGTVAHGVTFHYLYQIEPNKTKKKGQSNYTESTPAGSAQTPYDDIK
jgi:hypothetical protein